MLPESDVLEELRGGKAIPKRQKRLKSWFVGKIMARLGGRVDPAVAAAVVERVLLEGKKVKGGEVRGVVEEEEEEV